MFNHRWKSKKYTHQWLQYWWDRQSSHESCSWRGPDVLPDLPVQPIGSRAPVASEHKGYLISHHTIILNAWPYTKNTIRTLYENPGYINNVWNQLRVSVKSLMKQSFWKKKHCCKQWRCQDFIKGCKQTSWVLVHGMAKISVAQKHRTIATYLSFWVNVCVLYFSPLVRCCSLECRSGWYRIGRRPSSFPRHTPDNS